jgi:glycosyltransferase involved in cell wall biosynthesis
MINTFITIIIPLYNAEKYLIETLESISLQSYVEWQCIIVDDASTDRSVDLILEYIKQDDRFIFINRSDHSARKGANTCRNIGLKYTATNWVMFVDADDLLKQDCLKNRILTILSNLSRDMYVFRTAIVDYSNDTIGSFYNPNTITEDIIHRLVAHKVPWHTMSPIWQTDFLRKTGAWNENYERLQDIELNLRALIRQPLIYFSVGQCDSVYRLFAMTEGKTIAARFGFWSILKYYYNMLVNQDWFL